MNVEREIALSSTALTRRYRDDVGKAATAALQGIDLVVEAGQAAMLIGLNGAGKSTFLRLAAGVERPDEGKIAIFGRSPTHPESRRRTGYLPDGAELFPFLDARETLAFFAAAAGLDRATTKSESARLIEIFGMGSWAGKRAAGYSTGMRRRLALASVLIGKPDLLLLDEPASGLDPEATRQFLDVLRGEKARGAAIIMASHHLGHAEAICDRVVVLARGRLVYNGDVEGLATTIGHRDLTVAVGSADPLALLEAGGLSAGDSRVSERGLEDFLIAESRG